MMSPRGDEASCSDTVPPFGFAKGTWMPTERLAMRHVRDVIRLRSAGMPTREIARRMGQPLDGAVDDPPIRGGAPL